MADGVAMAEAKRAFAEGGDNPLVVLGVFFHVPAHESRAEIEIQGLIVVDDPERLVSAAGNAGVAVGNVALARDALVPVMIRRRRGIQRKLPRPGVLPRRLVEMAVNRHVAGALFHKISKDSV